MKKINKQWYRWYVALPISFVSYAIYFSFGGDLFGIVGGVAFLVGLINGIISTVKYIKNKFSKNTTKSL
jgi:hypothetical protein